MICCLNPDCPNPLNPDGRKWCQSCNSPLISLLRNRFRVIRVLSNEGGFGRTYLAEDTDKLYERCVIKQLAPKFQGNWAISKAMELFQQEAQRLQQLGEHPQIPTLIAYFEQENYLYLVQQLIDGHNLLKELQWRAAYSSQDIQEILLDLLPLLKFIHNRGVIHRDIKPQNIIRRKSDGRLCLIDFGSSKQLTARVQMKQGTSIGSHGYSPLEQIRDGAAYPASDLFSLGATCFHLLTGISPFKLWMENGYGWVKNWRQYVRISIGEQLATVIEKLLQKDIQLRYQSADEAIKELTFQSLPPVSSPATPRLELPPTQPPSVARQYAKLINLLTAGAAITLLVLGEFWYQQFRKLENGIASSINQSHNIPSQIQPATIPQSQFSLLKTLGGKGQAVVSVAISPDGNSIASASDRTITLWNLNTGEKISTLNGHSQKLNVLAISPDGVTLVSGSEDNTIKLWNLATGQEIRTLGGHRDGIHALVFSRNGYMLGDGSDDNTIKIWDLRTRKQVFTLKGHSSRVSSLVISPDGKILASGSFDNTIKLWNLKTGKKIRTLGRHLSGVTSLAISPDGKILASGSFDKTIKLWNLETAKKILTIKGHSRTISSLAISPDGKILATGSNDKTIKLWNLQTGKEIHTLKGHQSGIKSIAFSPKVSNAVTLISGSKDGNIKVWRVYP
ncbi:MAG: serine/threonine-protein kinase [Nostocaceae cyanobacterium]|nr:serine/threonine-protein kinase [Nostocaceae cyanobacterium]